MVRRYGLGMRDGSYLRTDSISTHAAHRVHPIMRSESSCGVCTRSAEPRLGTALYFVHWLEVLRDKQVRPDPSQVLVRERRVLLHVSVHAPVLLRDHVQRRPHRFWSVAGIAKRREPGKLVREKGQKKERHGRTWLNRATVCLSSCRGRRCPSGTALQAAGTRAVARSS